MNRQASATQAASDIVEDTVVHASCEQARVRILARRMVRADQGARVQGCRSAGCEVHDCTVRESRTRTRQLDAARRQQLQPRIPCDLAERDDDLQAWEVRDFVRQVRQAAPYLLGQRLVRGRGAPDCRCDVRVGQPQSIVEALRRGDIGEAGALQRRHQEVARRADAVAREHSSRPVCAVRRRGQPEDQHSCVRIPETGHGARPIRFVPKRCLFHATDFATVRAQPWAGMAINYLIAHLLKADALKGRPLDRLRGDPSGVEGGLRGRSPSPDSVHVSSLQHVTSGRRSPVAFNSPSIPDRMGGLPHWKASTYKEGPGRP